MVIPAQAVEAADAAYRNTVPTGDGSYQHRAIRAALEAAAPHMMATVTTAEELDALPVGSVVRTAGTESQSPRVAVKDAVWKNESEWFVADSSEWCLDSTELDDLPATVLHTGTPNAV